MNNKTQRLKISKNHTRVQTRNELNTYYTMLWLLLILHADDPVSDDASPSDTDPDDMTFRF